MSNQASPTSIRADVAHLARRAGFGLHADDLDRQAADGYEAAVDRVVGGLRVPDPAADTVVAPSFDTVRLLAAAESADEAVRTAAQDALREQQRLLVRWWLERMVVAAEPWHEKLTFLWHDHFATSLAKVRYPELLRRQYDTLYRLGGGCFDDLVHAMSRDGAMLLWLDGHDSRVGAPNENYARELLELFTLGHTPPAASADHGADGVHEVHGDPPYTEADVVAAARALTGWQVDRATGDGVFRADRHDPGAKTLLGSTGRLGLDEVVALTTGHPACAPHVVARLWSRLGRPATADDPVVVELAAPFAEDLDVTALLRRLFLHPAFRAPATRSALVKTPVEWMVGSLRALRHPLPDRGERVLVALGQVPFAPPDVAGWPANGVWLSTASARTRLEAAAALSGSADRSPIEAVAPGDRPAAVGRLLGIDAWSAGTEAALAASAADPERLLTLALVSPEHLLA
jgi:uncharacterized protein (DUF1800 family)